MTILTKMRINDLGDDFNQNRLFSYLNEQFPAGIQRIMMLRNNVYFIQLSSLPFILKGFSTYHRLKLQETFTSSLIKEEFTKTYQFYDLAKDPPLFFNRTYFGCLEYIEPSLEVFSYDNDKNRKEGLDLLRNYHDTTAKIVGRYQTLIGTVSLMEKWKDRMANFINNLSLIRFFLQQEILTEILAWADWAVKGMEREADFFRNGELVILHGDVAHHNFIRRKDGELHLIDFDLIHCGFAHSDYLQYANRILPFLNWSFKGLSKYEIIKPYLQERGFLYALGYPTDIFREWNRLVKEKNYSNPNKVRQVMEITMGQFYERRSFMNELIKRVNHKS